LADTKQGFERILVATDGSKGAMRACEVAALIAKTGQSSVVLLHVLPTISALDAPPSGAYYSQLERKANEMLDEAASRFETQGVKVEKDILQGRASIVQSIVEFAESADISLIVMGTRGLGGFKKLTLGSVSSGVVSHAHCSVLVAR